MHRKTILQDIALRLKKTRDALGFSSGDMAGRIGTYPATYYKYENARSFPHFTILSKLGDNLGISLDWLILDRGPMFYEEKENKTAAAVLPAEIQELVEQMEQIPVLKYEILLNFHKFKESRKVTATAPAVTVTTAAIAEAAAARAAIKQDMDNEVSHDV
jgi:transcriptional regulator with XRE-family HTH domain